MSEQELNMMGDERGKDEASASAMLKKHETLEAAIADYSETVNELGDTAKALVDSGHPERYVYCISPPLLVEELIHVRTPLRSVVKELFVYGSPGAGTLQHWTLKSDIFAKITAFNETWPVLLLNSEQVKIRQAQVDKLYEGLKDLAEERRGKLDETLKLYQLQGEIDDLEHWIAEKEVVAGSEDIGQDLAQVEVHLLV